MKEKYASFPITIILWFGTGICSFADVDLFPSIWKSIWHNNWQATEKLFHSAEQHWMLAANKAEDFLTWDTYSLGTLCKHSPGLLPALHRVTSKRTHLIWAFTTTSVSSHCRVENYLSSNLIQPEKVVLGLVCTDLWNGSRKIEREAMEGEGKCVCQLP